MASSLSGPLSPDLRWAIALTVNRQDLVNQQVGWAYPGIQVADSHVYVQGQQAYKPSAPTSPTTTIPVPTSSTSTTVIGAGGSVNFPVTPVPQQADALLQASGLVRTPGDPYFHSAFGVPFQLHMVYDASDPWAAAAGPVIKSELQAAGLDTTLLPVDGASKTGQVLADGFADLALMPVTFSPYLSQMLSWYTTLLGPAGQERLAGLDELLESATSTSWWRRPHSSSIPTRLPATTARRTPSSGTTWSRCRSSQSRPPWRGAGPSGE